MTENGKTRAEKALENRLVDAYVYLRNAVGPDGGRIPETRISEAYETIVTTLGLERYRIGRTPYFTPHDVLRIEGIGIRQELGEEHRQGLRGYSQAADRPDGYFG